MLRVNVEQGYEQFLELPRAVVLAVLWIVGAVLEGAFVAALYWIVAALYRNRLVLVQLLAGNL